MEEDEPVRSVVRGFPEEEQLGEKLVQHQTERKGGRSPNPKQSCLTEGMMHAVVSAQAKEENKASDATKTVAGHRAPSPDSVLAAVSSSPGWSLEGTGKDASEARRWSKDRKVGKKSALSTRMHEMQQCSRKSPKLQAVCEGARVAALHAMRGEIALDIAQARAKARVEAGHGANFTYVGVEGKVRSPQKEANPTEVQSTKTDEPCCVTSTHDTKVEKKETGSWAGNSSLLSTWIQPSQVVRVASSAMAAWTCIHAAVRLVGN